MTQVPVIGATISLLKLWFTLIELTLTKLVFAEFCGEVEFWGSEDDDDAGILLLGPVICSRTDWFDVVACNSDVDIGYFDKNIVAVNHGFLNFVDDCLNYCNFDLDHWIAKFVLADLYSEYLESNL